MGTLVSLRKRARRSFHVGLSTFRCVEIILLRISFRRSALRYEGLYRSRIDANIANRLNPANGGQSSEESRFSVFPIEEETGELNRCLWAAAVVVLAQIEGVSEAYHIPLDCGWKVLEGGVIRACAASGCSA